MALNSPSTTPDTSAETMDISSLQPWIDFYAKKNNIQVVMDPTMEYPAAVPDITQGADMKITINPILCKEQFNLSDTQLLQVLFHEIEHLKEDAQIMSTAGGKKIASQRIQRQKQQGKLATSYHLIENVLRDIYVNNEVVSTKNMPVLHDTLISNYKDHFYIKNDYTKLPLHLQLAYTLLRETFVPDEKCIIDPKIRTIVSRLQRNGTLQKTSEGKLEERLQHIWTSIEPIWKKLLDQDIQNIQNPPNSSNQGEGDKGEGKGESKDSSKEGDNSSPQSDKNSLKEKTKEILKKALGEKKPSETSSQGQKEKANPEENKDKNGDSGKNFKPEQGNPFAQEYKDFPTQPHILEQSLDQEDIEKLAKKLLEQIQDQNKTPEQLELEQKARNMGIDPNDKEAIQQAIQKLKQYDSFLKSIDQIKDSETGESVKDEITNLFQYIKSHREKKRYTSKAPVDIDHGVRLHPGAIASGIAEMTSGNDNPEMFEMDITYEKKQVHVGNFELSIIADGTGSMAGEKTKQQKIAIILVLEALKELHDLMDMEKPNLKVPLEFTTESLIFGANSRRIKPKDTDFTDQERLDVFTALDECDGPRNNEGLLLEKMYQEFDQSSDEEKRNIKQGKIKKIIFIFSDGGQDVPSYEKKLKDNIQNFRDDGVLVYGIGITQAGKSVLKIYNSDDPTLGGAQVCDNPTQLAVVLKNLLKEHLEKL